MVLTPLYLCTFLFCLNQRMHLLVIPVFKQWKIHIWLDHVQWSSMEIQDLCNAKSLLRCLHEQAILNSSKEAFDQHTIRQKRQPPMLFAFPFLVLYALMCLTSQEKTNSLQLYLCEFCTSTMAPKNFELGAISDVGHRKHDKAYSRYARLNCLLAFLSTIICSS